MIGSEALLNPILVRAPLPGSFWGAAFDVSAFGSPEISPLILQAVGGLHREGRTDRGFRLMPRCFPRVGKPLGLGV
jgi:hypothetical protein